MATHFVGVAMVMSREYLELAAHFDRAARKATARGSHNLLGSIADNYMTLETLAKSTKALKRSANALDALERHNIKRSKLKT